MDNTEELEGAPETPTGDGTDTGQPKSQSGNAKDWQASYKGLQSIYNKLKKAHEDLEAKYAQVVQTSEEANLNAGGKDKQLEVLNTELARLKDQIKTLEGEKANSDNKANRAQLIMSEFSELSEFEADGLLPNADTPEALKEAFTKFRDKLKKQGMRTERDKSKGAPPDDLDKSETTPDTGESEEYIWDKMMTTAGVDQAEFVKWQAKYDALLAARDK